MFEKDFTEKKKVFGEGKEIKLSLAWQIETEQISQEKQHFKTQPSEILTISLEGTGQDRV